MLGGWDIVGAPGGDAPGTGVAMSVVHTAQDGSDTLHVGHGARLTVSDVRMGHDQNTQ